MREIEHAAPQPDEPTSESIIETHLGVQPVPTRVELERLASLDLFDDNKIDEMLNHLIERSRGYSGYATLFLKGVKDGRY